MNTANSSRQPAFLCVLIFLLCALATGPYAEIGINDDWSYVQSTRILAQTGHIVYNGWSAPILGWQLFLGALFVKLFGPSFTSIRASMVFIDLLIAFLTHRTLIRAGVSSHNATIGSLSLVLSPLFLPFALIFMTDIGGVFCVVLCLYACLRALQARTDRATLAWLAFAALSNALGGTVRQIAWLGVLVMFPCTVWILRRRPYVLLAGALLYLVSIAIIYSSLHWFQQQPYTLSEALIPVPADRHWDRLIMQLWFPLSFAMLLLPILVAFVPAIQLRNRRTIRFLVSGAVLCTAAGLFLFPNRPIRFSVFLAPYKGTGGGNCVNSSGLGAGTPTAGLHPVILTFGPRMALSIAVLVALLCFFAVLFTVPRASQSEQTPSTISWDHLLILTVPFTLAYLALLIPRGLIGSMLRGDITDRYLLLIFPIGLILLLRIYHDRVQPDLPLFSLALVLLYALYAVAGTHDMFAMYRARLAAINELRAAGIPDSSIDGGWEQRAMTQIDRCGFINYSPIHMYAKAPPRHLHLLRAVAKSRKTTSPPSSSPNTLSPSIPRPKADPPVFPQSPTAIGSGPALSLSTSSIPSIPRPFRRPASHPSKPDREISPPAPPSTASHGL